MKKMLAVAVAIVVQMGVAIPAWSAVGDPPEALLQLEDAFTQVAEKSSPAVVVITNKRVAPQAMYPMQMIPPEFRQFFGVPDEPEDDDQSQSGKERRPTPVPAGKGSGVIFRGDGYILTNCHVIDESDALEVKLHDGRIFDNARDKNEVIVVGMDKETDLAVLRIGNGKLKDLPILAFADSSKVKIGQFAIAVGAPFNFDYSVSIGHVSQKGRYDVNINTYENYIQTDASINPGNSGGPLLNLHGDVIGINEFIVTGGMGRGSVGLGFAISSNLAKQVADSLIANNGVVIRPWLGISMQPLTEELKRQFKVDSGVLVNDVMKGDPAEKAGLRAGDVVLKVGDVEVKTPHDVQFAVLGYNPGDNIAIVIDRGGKTLNLQIVARQKDGTDKLAESAGGKDMLNDIGLSVEEGKDGMAITGIKPGSPAAAAQLRKGDLILEVNRSAVTTIRELAEALKESKNDVAVLYIDRRGYKFFVPLNLGSNE